MSDPADTTRERVLVAARREFDAGRSPSLAEVATAAGVSRATVHRVVGSRADLLRLLDIAPDTDTAGRVLAAAAEVVGEVGIARATMEDVADRAGVSRATVYRLFPGKEALFRGLIRVYSPLDAVVETVTRMAGRPPEEVVPEMVLAAVRAASPRPGVLRTILFEVTSAGAEAEAAMAEAAGTTLRAVGDYLAAQMQAGRLRPMHPLLALQALAGPVVFHLLQRPLLERLPGVELEIDPEAAAVEIAHHWLRAMRPEVTRP
jgi:AcrR family transcriptional regulator